ncbi:hypothetical protein NC652_017046 [Populus alba x Populus x berolinensis]|nr:hypothetical protein NC652_017046 [Populus alba x Populus x berolinensis]
MERTYFCFRDVFEDIYGENPYNYVHAFGACKSFGFTRGFLPLGSEEGAEDEKNPQEEGKTRELVCLCILSRWATWYNARSLQGWQLGEYRSRTSTILGTANLVPDKNLPCIIILDSDFLVKKSQATRSSLGCRVRKIFRFTWNFVGC